MMYLKMFDSFIWGDSTCHKVMKNDIEAIFKELEDDRYTVDINAAWNKRIPGYITIVISRPIRKYFNTKFDPLDVKERVLMLFDYLELKHKVNSITYVVDDNNILPEEVNSKPIFIKRQHRIYPTDRIYKLTIYIELD